VRRFENLVVLKTFSKAYEAAGASAEGTGTL
jgi:histidinol-phosphate/aromatic aminotransferase/cobyric acid decarboxylase-like protein